MLDSGWAELFFVGEILYPGYSGCVAFSRAGCARNRSLIFMYSRYGGRFDVHVKGSGLGTAHGRRVLSRRTGGRSFKDVIMMRGMFKCGRMLPLVRNSGLVKHEDGNARISVPVRASSPDVSEERYVVGIGHGGRKRIVCALHSGSDVAKAFLVGRVLKGGSQVQVRRNTVVALNTAALVLHTARGWSGRACCLGREEPAFKGGFVHKRVNVGLVARSHLCDCFPCLK